MKPEELFASDQDREDFERVERDHRWRSTPQSLYVNTATREMISPNGMIDDETIARWEAKYRERRPPEER
jgi:hypothetical protein